MSFSHGVFSCSQNNRSDLCLRQLKSVQNDVTFINCVTFFCRCCRCRAAFLCFLPPRLVCLLLSCQIWFTIRLWLQAFSFCCLQCYIIAATHLATIKKRVTHTYRGLIRPTLANEAWVFSTLSPRFSHPIYVLSAWHRNKKEINFTFIFDCNLRAFKSLAYAIIWCSQIGYTSMKTLNRTVAQKDFNRKALWLFICAQKTHTRRSSLIPPNAHINTKKIN